MAIINELLDTIPDEPLTPTIDMTPRWRLFFEQFQMMLGRIGGIIWAQINKKGSRLSDIETRPHSDLQDVQGNGVLHVSPEEKARWDAAGSSNVLTWLIGG